MKEIGSTVVACAALISGAFAQDAQFATPRQHARYLENRGQWPAQVLYHTNFGVLALWAERDRITFSKWQDGIGDQVHELLHQPEAARSGVAFHGHAWRMELVGAEPAAIHANAPGITSYNYFIGNDPSKWASDVHAFEELVYQEAWPGVDVRLHSSHGSFEYDVVLAAGSNVDRVSIAYEGLAGTRIDEEGRLVLVTSVGELMEMQPTAWYADGAREAVACAFTLKKNIVGFDFGTGTDTSRPIVIDPVLVASTLSGTGDIGTTQNYGHTATYDQQGNIYTGCICFGQGYPTTTGAFDATFGGGFGVDIAVSKLTPDGTDLLAATYLGGGGGDYPHSLVVTNAGQLCVYGSSDSNDYPVSSDAFDATANGGADIVVTKLTPNMNNIVGSTYVGTNAEDGRNNLTYNYGDSYRGEIITDGLGDILIASCTSGSGFPTTTGAYQTVLGGGQDGVLFSLAPDLSAMNWCTYMGSIGGDMCFGIKLDDAGGVYACGATDATTFPTTTGAYQTASGGDHDGFVVHLTNNATTLLQSTYFGYASGDDAFFLQVDNNDHVYIYGQTDNVPIAPTGTYGEAGGPVFVAELLPDLSATVFTTELGYASGGFVSMVPVAFLVDNCRRIYISGYGVSSGMTISTDALYTTGGFYLAVYDQHMTGTAPLYATYYSGAGHVDGGTSRFDKNGIVYQAVCTSGGFPTTPGAWSNTQPGGWDVGVFKIDFEQNGVNANITASALAGCAPDTVQFSAWGEYETLVWDFGDGSPTSTDTMPSHLYTDPGTYIVTLIAFDPTSCNLSDTATVIVSIGSAVTIEPSFTYTQAGGCEPYTVVLTNTTPGGDNDYFWDLGDGTTATTTNVTHTYPGAGTYTVWLTVTDNLCQATDSAQQEITVTEPVPLEALFTSTQTDFCTGLTITTVNVSTGPPGLVYTWDMGDGTILTGGSVSYTYTEPGTYTVELLAYDPLCDEGATYAVEVEVQESPLLEQGLIVPNIFSPNSDGENDSFFPIPNAKDNVELTVYNRWGQKIYETPGAYQPWDGRVPNNKPAPDGVYYYLLDYKLPCLGTEITGREEGYVHIVR